MMPAISINRVDFNTGKSKEISIKNLALRPYDRIAMQWVIGQAETLEGVDIGENIILKIHADVYRYVATFAYGTYTSNEVFLVSAGARTKDAMDGLWKQLSGPYVSKYKVTTPITRKPAGPMVVDIVLPCSNPNAISYLYSSDCYDLCTKLGWALLYPECVRI